MACGQSLMGAELADGQPRKKEKGLPTEFVNIRSALGAARPRHVLAVPFSHEGVCMGVVEFGLLAIWVTQRGLTDKLASDTTLAASAWYWTVGAWLVFYAVVYWTPRVLATGHAI